MAPEQWERKSTRQEGKDCHGVVRVKVSLKTEDLSCHESTVIQLSPAVFGKLAIVERTDGWLTLGWDLAKQISSRESEG